MRAAAIQLTSTADLDRNLEVADRLTRAAARDGATLIVLPEKWTGFGTNEIVRAAAGRAGEALGWARATAAELGVDLIAGSMAMPAGDRSQNTAVHVGPDGAERARYVKLHLFDVEVDGTVYAESDEEDGGDAVTVTELADGTRVGLSICYDLRFAALFEAQQRAGATVLAVPSAFTLATTRDHWEVLVRARAIEQQAFVVAANQVGEHAPGLRSGGRSMIVDPWGVVLATAPDTESHVIADLDPTQQQDIRRRLPALRHRRTEVLG